MQNLLLGWTLSVRLGPVLVNLCSIHKDHNTQLYWWTGCMLPEIYMPWTVSLFAAQSKQAQDGCQLRQEACWGMGRTHRSITGQHSRSAEVYKYKRKLFRIHLQWHRYPVHPTFYAVHQNGRSLKLCHLYDIIAITLSLYIYIYTLQKGNS